MASRVIRDVPREHILPSPIFLAGSNGELYQLRPLTPDDCYYFQEESHDWARIDSACTIPISESATRTLSEHSSLFSSICLYHNEVPAAMLVATFRSVSHEYPAEGIYIRVLFKKIASLSKARIDLLTFARDLYFARIPWLLSVLVEVPNNAGYNGNYSEFETNGFRFCGSVGGPGKSVLLFESERPRWLKQHQRDMPNPPSGIGFLDKFSTLVGKPVAGAPVVFFGTGSREKRAQYQYLFRCYGIDVQAVKHSVSLIEPQVEGYGPDSETALVHEPLKLFSRFAAREASYPFIIEDTMLFIEHFNTDFERRPMLPGPDTKRWWGGLGTEGILRIMHGSEQRRALYVCQLGVHVRPGEYSHFRAELEGSIATSLRSSALAQQLFPYTNATFFHSVFIPNGATNTLAEMDPSEFKLYDYRRRCLAGAADSLRRYAQTNTGLQLEIPFESD